MVKCRWRYSELRRRDCPSDDPASALGERRFDDVPLAARLACQPRRRGNPRLGLHRLRRQPGRVDGKDLARTHNHGPLDYVLQLADVTWPIVVLQQLQGLLVDRLEAFSRPGGVALHEVLNESQDVVCTGPKRWHFDGKDIESIEQVLAETPAGHGGTQITVGGRDDSYIDADRLRASDPLEFALLQHSEEHHLRVEGKFTHFIQEDGPTVGHLEPAESPLQGTGESAFLVTEQF